MPLAGQFIKLQRKSGGSVLHVKHKHLEDELASKSQTYTYAIQGIKPNSYNTTQPYSVANAGGQAHRTNQAAPAFLARTPAKASTASVGKGLPFGKGGSSKPSASTSTLQEINFAIPTRKKKGPKNIKLDL
jgi:hypothetical protein